MIFDVLIADIDGFVSSGSCGNLTTKYESKSEIKEYIRLIITIAACGTIFRSIIDRQNWSIPSKS